MSKWRKAAKVDSNQAAIVEALRNLGVTVQPGHDDILCGYQGKTFWFELKSQNCVSKRTGKVRESAKKQNQIELERDWKGHYQIVSSLDEILEAIGLRPVA